MTKPVLLANRRLRDAFEEGARTPADLTASEKLTISAEYLRNETASGAFSPEAWDLLCDGESHESAWKHLVEAATAKAQVVRNNTAIGKEMLRRDLPDRLKYQAAAVHYMDALLRGATRAAEAMIEQALAEMEDTQEAE